MGQIKYLRLITGEDLVSEVEEQGNKVVLINPLRLVYMANPLDPARISISMTYWIFPRWWMNKGSNWNWKRS